MLWAFDTSTPTFCSIYSIHTSTTQAYDVESRPSVYKSIEHVHGFEHPDPGVSSQTQEILTNKDDHKDILCRANIAGPAHIDHGSHFAQFAFWRAALQIWMAAKGFELFTTHSLANAAILAIPNLVEPCPGLSSPLLYMASTPETMALTTIKAPMAASKRNDSTIFFKDGCLGDKPCSKIQNQGTKTEKRFGAGFVRSKTCYTYIYLQASEDCRRWQSFVLQ